MVACISIDNQSLRLEFLELRNLTAQCEELAIGIHESREHPGISDMEVLIQGTDISRADRRRDIGGSCAVYISSNHKTARLINVTLDQRVFRQS